MKYKNNQPLTRENSQCLISNQRLPVMHTKQENMTIMRKNITSNTSRTGTDTLADEDIKRVIIVVFYVLKKLSGDRKDIFKTIKSNI